MSTLPKQIDKFIEEFSRLPSVGPRMARRLAFYLVNLDDQTFENISSSLVGLGNIDRCPKCFFIKNAEKDICDICSDQQRNNDIVAVVEKETDLLSMEASGGFKGLYLILGESGGGGNLSKTQKLRLDEFKNRARKKDGGVFEEVILATSPNTEGDLLADMVRDKIEDVTKKTTRLGRGLPTGSEVEFADPETLSQALKSRS